MGADSRFLTALRRLLGVNISFATAYYPQTDGQVRSYTWNVVPKADNQCGGDLYTDAISDGYSCGTYRSIGMKPFTCIHPESRIRWKHSSFHIWLQGQDRRVKSNVTKAG